VWTVASVRAYNSATQVDNAVPFCEVLRQATVQLAMNPTYPVVLFLESKSAA
jgi:hypothetical protein